MSAEEMTFPCGAKMRIDLPQGFPSTESGNDLVFSMWQSWHDSRCNCNSDSPGGE